LSAGPQQGGICVALVSHVLNPPVQSVFERLRRELPADHDLRMLLSQDDTSLPLLGLAEAEVDRITLEDALSPGYPEKCRRDDWAMAGNLDLVFLEFARRHPDYAQYWFVEYDVFWQGRWEVFFEHFRGSTADVLAATVQRIDEVPHKLDLLSYPRTVVPEGLRWERHDVIKAFLPICRISRRALDALHAAYEAGLGGHYEFNVPSIAAQNGMELEDFGGNGTFVRPENRDRFYFARGAAYTHSPGNFVFRPDQRVLKRENTLWHPVKPEGVPLWHPLLFRGSTLKTTWEWVKPFIGRRIIWLWFAFRWRPLRSTPPSQGFRKTGAPVA